MKPLDDWDAYDLAQFWAAVRRSNVVDFTPHRTDVPRLVQIVMLQRAVILG